MASKVWKTAVAAAMSGAVLLTGCGANDEQSASAVCVDQTTQERLPDSECGDGSSSGSNAWLWFLVGTQVGGIGSRMSGGSYTQPSNVSNYYYGGAPTTGGRVPATGFRGAVTTPPRATPRATPVRPATPAPTASAPKATASPSASSSSSSSKAKAPAPVAKPKAPAPKVKAPAPKAKAPAPKAKAPSAPKPAAPKAPAPRPAPRVK